MGFMTEVGILNDGFDTIEEDPKGFVRTIKHAMNGPLDYHGKSYGLGNHGNVLAIYPSHHADTPRLLLAWRNSFQVLDRYVIEDEWKNAAPDHPVWKALEDEVARAEALLAGVKELVATRKVW